MAKRSHSSSSSSSPPQPQLQPQTTSQSSPSDSHNTPKRRKKYHSPLQTHNINTHQQPHSHSSVYQRTTTQNPKVQRNDPVIQESQNFGQWELPTLQFFNRSCSTNESSQIEDIDNNHNVRIMRQINDSSENSSENTPQMEQVSLNDYLSDDAAKEGSAMVLFRFLSFGWMVLIAMNSSGTSCFQDFVQTLFPEVLKLWVCFILALIGKPLIVVLLGSFVADELISFVDSKIDWSTVIIVVFTVLLWQSFALVIAYLRESLTLLLKRNRSVLLLTVLISLTLMANLLDNLSFSHRIVRQFLEYMTQFCVSVILCDLHRSSQEDDHINHLNLSERTFVTVVIACMSLSVILEILNFYILSLIATLFFWNTLIISATDVSVPRAIMKSIEFIRKHSHSLLMPLVIQSLIFSCVVMMMKLITFQGDEADASLSIPIEFGQELEMMINLLRCDSMLSVLFTSVVILMMKSYGIILL